MKVEGNVWPSRLTFNCVGEKIPLYNGVSSESIISLARHGGGFSLRHVERERERESLRLLCNCSCCSSTINQVSW